MNDYSALFTGKPSAAASAPAVRYRLLIVDDEPGVVKALTRVFRQERYEVVTAANGEEGLQRLAEATTHLVISDYMMPGMTGAQFLQTVKEASPDTIRIMLTRPRRYGRGNGSHQRGGGLQVHPQALG